MHGHTNIKFKSTRDFILSLNLTEKVKTINIKMIVEEIRWGIKEYRGGVGGGVTFRQAQKPQTKLTN